MLFNFGGVLVLVMAVGKLLVERFLRENWTRSPSWLCCNLYHEDDIARFCDNKNEGTHQIKDSSFHKDPQVGSFVYLYLRRRIARLCDPKENEGTHQIKDSSYHKVWHDMKIWNMRNQARLGGQREDLHAGMANETSNAFSHVKLNEDNIENDMVEGDSNEDIENDMVEVESNEDNIENEIVELNEMVETKGVENKVEDPKLEMMFDSIVDAMIHYKRYAKEKGFAVAKRTSKKRDDGVVTYVTIAHSYVGKPKIKLNRPGIKRTRSTKKGDDGVVRYVTIACSYAGKPRIRLNCPGIKRTRSTNPIKLKPQTKIDCKAQLKLVLCSNGKWILRSMVLDHNHGLSPTGVHENLSFLEKDCRNHMEKVKCSHLGKEMLVQCTITL
nr:hypothetical protein CFP56_56349 [Quercus suber]